MRVPNGANVGCQVVLVGCAWVVVVVVVVKCNAYFLPRAEILGRSLQAFALFFAVVVRDKRYVLLP